MFLHRYVTYKFHVIYKQNYTKRFQIQIKQDYESNVIKMIEIVMKT